MKQQRVYAALIQSLKATGLAAALALTACGGGGSASPPPVSKDRFVAETNQDGVEGIRDNTTGILWAKQLVTDPASVNIDLLPYANELMAFADGEASVWQSQFAFIGDQVLMAREVAQLANPQNWVVDFGESARGLLAPSPGTAKAWYVLDRDPAKAAPSVNWVASPSGVVYGSNGLIWQLCTNQSSAYNPTTGCQTPIEAMPFASVQQHVATANKNQYGGFGDWRLPTKLELQSLLQFEGASDLLPQAFGGDKEKGLSTAPRWLYWTASTVEPDGRWTVNFTARVSDGGVSLNGDYLNESAFVRLVRSGP